MPAAPVDGQDQEAPHHSLPCAACRPRPAPRPIAAPVECLDSLRRTVAATTGPEKGGSGVGGAAEGLHPASAAAAATAERAAELRRVVEDEREVGAELATDPADSSTCRLTLRVLAPGRTLAALATQLIAAQRAPHIKARLHQQLQAGAARRAAHARLLSSQRAQLLAAARCTPLPHPRAALARVLQEAVGQRRVAGRQPRQQAQAAAEPAAEMQRRRQRRQQLGEAVLGQHKELKRAWREKRWDPAGSARLPARAVSLPAQPCHALSAQPAKPPDLCLLPNPPTVLKLKPCRATLPHPALPCPGRGSSASAWRR